jgi:hypothetical protein
MGRMSATKTTILLEFQLLGGVLLVLRRRIVPLLALGTGKRDDVSHGTLPL